MRMRYRMTNNAILLLMLLSAPFLVRAIVWQIEFRILTMGSTEVLMLAAFFLLRSDRPQLLAVNLAMCGIAIGVFGAVYSNGGLSHTASGWLYVLPLFAGLMGGWRAGVVWSVLTLAGIVIFWWAESSGMPLPQLTPDSSAQAQNNLQRLMQYLAISSCMLTYLYQVKVTDDKLLEKISDLNDEVVERKKAEEATYHASQAKSQFLASMSHELRTPLNSVIGFAERLVRRKKKELVDVEDLESDREYGALQSIHHNGLHLLSLINGLLDLSKIEAGQESLELETIVMPGFLNDLADDLRGIAESKNLSLESEVTGSCVIQADSKKLKQIFINLIGNSLKFTDEGGVRITGFMAENEAGACAVIQISDTGIGIGEEELGYLFEPYYNIVSKGRNTSESTGLGLSITKALIDLHQGSIAVESTPGEGSQFTVTLPSGDSGLPPST